jgi:ankyrin repeat protein
LLVDNGADVNSSNCVEGESAVSIAAGLGYTNIVAILLKTEKVKLEIMIISLYKAANNDFRDIVKLIFQENIDVKKLRQSFQMVIQLGLYDMAKIFIDKKIELDAPYFEVTPIVQAAGYKHTDIMALLLNSGETITPKSLNKALMVAMIRNLYEGAELLVKHGADPNAYFGGNETILEHARTRNDERMIAILESSESQLTLNRKSFS